MSTFTTNPFFFVKWARAYEQGNDKLAEHIYRNMDDDDQAEAVAYKLANESRARPTVTETNVVRIRY